MNTATLRKLAVALVFAGTWTLASAQDWPARPIKIIVPWPPGGSVDVLARVLAPHLSESMKQPVVVENRAGAAGNIGSDAVAKAPADGYTLLVGSNSTHVMNPALFQRMPFSGVDDFTPIAVLTNATTVLVAHPSVGADTPAELIAVAKARPNPLNYASAGIGSQPHLSAELFARAAGVQLVHVPYKGSVPAAVDLVAGQVQLMFTAWSNVQEYVKGGRLKLIAVLESQRSPLIPNTPTIGETLPGFAVDAYYGLMAPKGLPRAIRERLHAEAARALAVPQVKTTLQDAGLVPAGTVSSEAFDRQLRADLVKWSRIIKDTGARAD